MVAREIPLALASLRKSASQRSKLPVFWQLVLAAAPGVARVHVILATIYAKHGDDAEMVPAIDKAVALNPLDNNLVRFRASSLRQAGRIDEARAAVLRAMELDPKNSSNYWELSLSDYARGDLVDAIVNSGKGYVMDPEDSESPAVSAVFLGEIGEIAAAQAWLPESERLSPGNIHAASAAVSVAYDRGDMQAAMDGALRGHVYAKAAVDIACWDVLGRFARTPVATLLGGVLAEDFPLYVAIPLGPVKQMVARVNALRADGVNAAAG